MLDAASLKPLIVERIAKGEFVEDICATDGMPSESTFYAWHAADDEFRSQCARAREASAGIFERKVVQLANDCIAGTIDPKAANAAGNLLTWVAKVRNRKVYGDKAELEHKGGERFGLAITMGAKAAA